MFRTITNAALGSLVSFFILYGSAHAETIRIFCYHGTGDKLSYFPLEGADAPVEIEARFNAASGAYTVAEGDLLNVVRMCSESAVTRGLAFHHVAASSLLSAKLYNWYFGKFSQHFPLIDEGSISPEVIQARQIINVMPEQSQFSVDLVHDVDQAKLLAKFWRKIYFVNSMLPLKAFLQGTAESDFARMDFVVLKGEEVLYEHSVENLNSSYPAIFDAIENEIDGDIVISVGALELRKYVAFALATRSQAFDANPLLHIATHLMRETALAGIPCPRFVNNGSTHNIIRTDRRALILESEMVIDIVFGEKLVVGSFLCNRKMGLELETGRITRDFVSISQFTVL